MPDFISGLELSRIFYTEAVEPLLTATFPDLRYSAALLGSGSEILGFDTPMSTDHHWGPRVMLFLSPADLAHHREVIGQLLAERLPYEIRGYSTNFAPPDMEDGGTQLLQPIQSGLVNHRVEMECLANFTESYLGLSLTVILEDGLSPIDWLTVSGQKLRTVAVAGAVYRDDTGELSRLREKLAYYPADLWRYLMAAGWLRIAEEEPFVGRTGGVGDELGSRLIGARLVHDVMSLCFLLERQYAPYSKWFGTAFQRLDCAAELTPILQRCLDAATWQARETALAEAYQFLAQMHNALQLTAPLPTLTRPFFSRPFQVIHADRFAAALLETITDPAIQRLAQTTRIGSIEQFSTSTPFLSSTPMSRRARYLYEDEGDKPLNI